MITEIVVEGQRLDITADISSLLTFAIDDIRDFASRSTTFSKTIVLPGTANNNRIFGSQFETGISNNYDPTLKNIGINFNPSVSAKCIIFQDFMQTFSGTLRILEIDIDKHRIEYQVALNGNLTGLSVALGSAFLTDLDFTAYNQLWTEANIVASWDNTPGSGVYFPLVDYGTVSPGKHDWDFRAFRPALYVKEYIDKMFAASGNPSTAVVAGVAAGTAAKGAALAGGATPAVADAAYTTAYNTAFTAALPAAAAGAYRYQCDLFNTDRFKRLVIPHNQKQLTKVTDKVFDGEITSTYTVWDSFMIPTSQDLFFGSVIAGLFTNTAGKIFTYTGATPISMVTSINLFGDYTFTGGAFMAGLVAKVVLLKNGVVYYDDGQLFSINLGSSIGYLRNWAIPVSLVSGDTLEISYQLVSNPAGCSGSILIFNTGSSWKMNSSSPVSSPVDYNELIDFKFAIPQNIRQVDFLVSIVKLFNLYVYEDKFDDRLIHITPFIDFFTSSSENALDWTYKMDRDKVIKIGPMSELNSRLYRFAYANDSDYWNALYSKRYNQGYGSLLFDSLFEFATNTTDVALIFAPTPLVGYVGEDKVFPTTYKLSGSVEEQVDSVIRIMQTKKIIGVSSWNMMNGVGVIGPNTNYGYGGHFDDPNNPDNDLNFGALNELFFTLVIGDLTKTQFNIYWSAYMAEITDKDSKILTAQFYLTALDIFNLSFAKYITVDGTLFRLNKIKDYNATSPNTCEVELLKVINTSYSFPAGSVPEASRTLDDATGDQLEYSPGMAILYF